MLVVVVDNDDNDREVGRFETEVVPQIGDRIELVPRDRPVDWSDWEVRGSHWVALLEGADDGEPDGKGVLDYLRLDAVQVVRTDQLPHPWNLG